MRVAILGLISAVAIGTSASATVYVPGDPGFTVTPEPGYTIFNSPVINGYFGVNPPTAGTFTDDFDFTIPQSGSGTGSVTTTASVSTSSNFVKFLSITFDGMVVPITTINLPGGGIQQIAGLAGVPITFNVPNDLKINYTSAGAGSYGGQLTFEAAAVPEPATWATFLLGFGIIGFAFRRNGRKPALARWTQRAA